MAISLWSRKQLLAKAIGRGRNRCRDWDWDRPRPSPPALNTKYCNLGQTQLCCLVKLHLPQSRPSGSQPSCCHSNPSSRLLAFAQVGQLKRRPGHSGAGQGFSHASAAAAAAALFQFQGSHSISPHCPWIDVWGQHNTTPGTQQSAIWMLRQPLSSSSCCNSRSRTMASGRRGANDSTLPPTRSPFHRPLLARWA